MRICIMQPYFLPYPGYYFLYKYVDLFVILDDVQFNRRGYVHRNKFIIGNNYSWVTLPLKKISRNANINNLEFNNQSYQYTKFLNIMKKNFSTPTLSFLENDLINLELSPLNYINKLNQKITEYFGINKKTILSSTLNASNLKHEEKIIDICKKLKASEYFNLSGGKKLYNKYNFHRQGIKIYFLKEFKEKISILNYISKGNNVFSDSNFDCL